MAKVTIELDDDVYARISEQATAVDMSVEQLVATFVLAQSVASDQDVTPEFRELISSQMKRYERLFARLAE